MARTHCHGKKLQDYKRKGMLYCHICYMNYAYDGTAIGIHGIKGIFTQEQLKDYYARESENWRKVTITETPTARGFRYTFEHKPAETS